ncbi:MAG TPA: hypothetical protein VK738_15525 [Terriglobales bacterium]|jgi:hypothetical protein|nr:hypothetical protein [Terriglobales bacterium]
MSDENRLIVNSQLFEQTLFGLRERSVTRRESGAIWAGKIDGTNNWVGEQVYFHHELCDERGTALSLELTEAAKFQLYQKLSKEGRQLIALLHTHPEDWVDLSSIDQDNQLSSRIGFWSIVIPWYARPPWDTEAMGIHVRSNPGWYRLTESEIRRRFLITHEK